MILQADHLLAYVLQRHDEFVAEAQHAQHVYEAKAEARAARQSKENGGQSKNWWQMLGRNLTRFVTK